MFTFERDGERGEVHYYAGDKEYALDWTPVDMWEPAFGLILLAFRRVGYAGPPEALLESIIGA